MQFNIGSNEYALKNFWFGDVSLAVFCNGEVLYSCPMNSTTADLGGVITFESPNGPIKIEARAKLFHTSFVVTYPNSNGLLETIDLENSFTEDLKTMVGALKTADYSFRFPREILSNPADFVFELMGLCLILFLFASGRVLEPFILCLLTSLYFVNVKIKLDSGQKGNRH